MNFKLAELRKKHNMTQQELGEILSVSYQTISKWENGISYPDMSLLPQIKKHAENIALTKTNGFMISYGWK